MLQRRRTRNAGKYVPIDFTNMASYGYLKIQIFEKLKKFGLREKDIRITCDLCCKRTALMQTENK